MEILSTTLGQMTVLFSLILLGFLLAKLKAVPENTATVLSKLENNLFVPALVLGTMVYMWGVPCLLIPSDREKQSIKNRLKSFANPMFAALIIGGVIGLAGITLPTPIMTVVTTAGNCMSPIAMLLTGITVANMDVKKVLSMKSIVVCTICSLAMPLGLGTIVVPGGYGKDTSVAAGMTIVSHLLSAITIPTIFYIMMMIV